MKFSTTILMAYADGELDAATRLAVEAEMAVDPQIAQEIARHRELQAKLHSAFGGVLTEEVPDHLLSTARTAPAGNPAGRNAKIADLASARATRQDAQIALRRRWSWPEWGAMAASLLIGVIVARAPWSTGSADAIVAENGRVIAAGALASALTRQPGGTQDSPVQIGVSFRAKSGEYCRTFAVREGNALAGFACREAEDWRVRALAQSESGGSTTEYRMAGTAIPPIIVQAVEDTMEGDALDAAAEAAALAKGWK
jgi:hypothetical protein